MQRRLSCILALCILLLTGCTDSYPPPAPRSLLDINHTATEDGQLAIAVDPTGTKHILRAVCPTDGAGSGCKMTYESTRQGEIGVLLYFYPPQNYSLKYPSITVTDSGIAFMVWQSCPDDLSKSRQCATMYTRSDDMRPFLLDFGTFSLAAPLVVSRGETVYALHEVASYDDPSGSGLRYCNITNPTYSCYWVSTQPGDGVRRTNAAAAVSSAGSLHVIWLEGGSAKTAYLSDNAGALNSDMSHLINMGNGNLLAPVIAIETDDNYLYTLVAKKDLPSHTMNLFYCGPAACMSSVKLVTISLDPAKHWLFADPPSLAVNSGYAFFGFAAKNDTHPSQVEIYIGDYTPNPPQTTADVSPLLTTHLDNCEPEVLFVENGRTVAWHTCGFANMRGSIYFYDMVNGERTIHVSNDLGRGDFKIAVNGEWVAGIWNEERPDGRLETWLAINAKTTYLPAVMK